MLPIIRISKEVTVPDNDQWQFRFKIRSETSDRIYIIAQHKLKNIGAAPACRGSVTGIVNT
jgi:hypothetical protein